MAIVIAAFVGSVYALVMFLTGIVTMYGSFRSIILDMRVGKYPEGLKEIPLIMVTPMTGYIFANAFMAFLFNLLNSSLVLIPVFWILTYQWIWENKTLLLGILVLNIWNIMKPGVVKKFVLNEEGIVSRPLLAAY